MKIGLWISGVTFFMFFLCAQSTVFALTDTALFKVRAFVGIDTLPPTTPILTAVVPVSPNQINVTWSPSIDDVLLIGYQLFRDGTQIATTSQTTFTDTGLVPGTRYEYTVDAYDSFDNISSTSVPVATTTVALPIATTTSTTTPRSKSTGTLLTRLDSFSLISSERSAALTWQTNTNTSYTLSWGRTLSYELGSISTNVLKQAHETTIDTLEPGTHYWYQIEATDGANVSQIIKSGDFTTIPAFQSILPPNVRNILVTVRGSDVSLRWQNPPLAEGDRVRVVRSHLFYPQTSTDGALVYEGDALSINDLGALGERSPQYYTIFVISNSGVISSGAIARAERAVVRQDPNATTAHPVPVSPVTTTDAGEVTVLRAENIFIRQGTVTQTAASPITLNYEDAFTIYIPVDAVAAHLKSIIVSLQDPTDQRMVTTYLLKLNPAGDAYVTVIEAPHVVGSVRMMVEVYDFNLASVRRIGTSIRFVTPQVASGVFPDGMVRWYNGLALVPLVLGVAALFGLWWWLMFARKRRREDNT